MPHVVSRRASHVARECEQAFSIRATSAVGGSVEPVSTSPRHKDVVRFEEVLQGAGNIIEVVRKNDRSEFAGPQKPVNPLLRDRTMIAADIEVDRSSA